MTRAQLFRGVTSALSLAAMAVGLAAMTGCPATQFPDEGPGQPGDWVSGIAPPGIIGVCKEPKSKRPPIVNPLLWQDARICNRITPRRYLRLGYSREDIADDPKDRQMAGMLDSLRAASSEKDGNVRMLTMMRDVKAEVQHDPKLETRLSRQTSRTFACDYRYLFRTTDKQFHRLQDDPCPAYAYDPKERKETCLFDLSVKEALWFADAWGCLAFTDTVGEGNSCYRMCSYDDFCAAQISCSAPDFDLALCALGVCTPEKVAGIL